MGASTPSSARSSWGTNRLHSTAIQWRSFSHVGVRSWELAACLRTPQNPQPMFRMENSDQRLHSGFLRQKQVSSHGFMVFASRSPGLYSSAATPQHGPNPPPPPPLISDLPRFRSFPPFSHT